MRVVIDRFEGSIAFCEDEKRNIVKIPRNSIPDGAHEGSVLEMGKDSISLMPAETSKRSSFIKNLMNGLWK